MNPDRAYKFEALSSWELFKVLCVARTQLILQFLQMSLDRLQITDQGHSSSWLTPPQRTGGEGPFWLAQAPTNGTGMVVMGLSKWVYIDRSCVFGSLGGCGIRWWSCLLFKFHIDLQGLWKFSKYGRSAEILDPADHWLWADARGPPELLWTRNSYRRQFRSNKMNY